jgi:catechol 2,3-dioxygenase-like lactoylglutathione lyase family enzyme
MSRGIVGFGHVTIVVNDLAATKQFYGTLLALPEANRPDWAAPGLWYRIGAGQLHIQVKPEFRPDPHPVGPHFALYTAATDYHATIARLEAVGVHFQVPPHQDPSDGRWRAFCKDPTGNTVEITDHDPAQ